jgi:hypothetical protein
MQKFERLWDPGVTPNSKSIQDILGKRNFLTWGKIKDYLSHAYETNPDLQFYGKKYGWCYKYKKGSKTLCCLFPEKGSFTVLITLGRNELEKLNPDFSKLSVETQEAINKAHQYHDGKWLWIRLPNMGNIKDVKRLLSVKRKPKE